MEVIQRAHNSTITVNILTKLYEQGHIFINDVIDNALAEDIKQQILYLAASDDKPIYIHINSPGGSISAGLLIYDTMQAYKERIYTICSGQAASMAAILVASAMKGHRYVLSNSELMIHEPLLGNKIEGNCSSIMATSQRLNDVKDRVNSILALHTGKSIKQIDKATSFDNYFDANKAIEFGLCDKIISINEIMEVF